MAAQAADAMAPDINLKTRQVPQSHHASAQSRQLSELSHYLLKTLPANLRGRLPQLGSRLRRELLRDLIVDLCAWQHSECPGVGCIADTAGA